MSEDIRREDMDRELDLDGLEQDSGGTGELMELISRIKRDNRTQELKDILRNEGKAAAAARCCSYYGDLCGYAAAVVTML